MIVKATNLRGPHGAIHRGHRFAKLVADRKGRQRIALRHCEPTGPRKARPDDRLREAIQMLQVWIASSLALLAMTVCGGLDRNDSRGIFA